MLLQAKSTISSSAKSICKTPILQMKDYQKRSGRGAFRSPAAERLILLTRHIGSPQWILAVIFRNHFVLY